MLKTLSRGLLFLGTASWAAENRQHIDHISKEIELLCIFYEAGFLTGALQKPSAVINAGYPRGSVVAVAFKHEKPQTYRDRFFVKHNDEFDEVFAKIMANAVNKKEAQDSFILYFKNKINQEITAYTKSLSTTINN